MHGEIAEVAADWVERWLRWLLIRVRVSLKAWLTERWLRWLLIGSTGG